MAAMLRDWGVLRTADRSAWLAVLVWGPMSVAYFGIQGVLLNLYLLRLGFDLKFIGLLIASGQVVWAVAALPAGEAAKRFGLRRVLIWSGLLMGAAMSLFLLVDSLPRGWWPAGFAICWMLEWVGAAVVGVNSTPYLMQVTTPQERNHAFSAQQAMIVLFGFAGSLVAGFLPGLFAGWFGGALAEPGPYRAALWLAPPLYGLAALTWVAARPVTLGEAETVTGQAGQPLGLFVLLGVVAFLQTASEGAINAFFNLYLDVRLHLPTAEIGTVLGLGRLLSVIPALAVPMVFRRWGTARSMAWATVGAGLALLPVAAIANVLAAGLGYVSMMCLVIFNATGRAVFSQEIVPAQWRTTTSAIVTIGLAAGWASAAAAGGYLIAFAGFGGLFFLSAVLAWVAAGILFVYVRARPGRHGETG